MQKIGTNEDETSDVRTLDGRSQKKKNTLIYATNGV